MGKPTILCIDDEMLVLTSLRDALSQMFGTDYRIEIAASGEEALEVITELVQSHTEIPLIISDQMMPGVKGDELLAKIHQIYPRTLKVMLTGQASAEAVGNAVNQADLFRYIAKPWSDTLLIGVVQEALTQYFQDKQLDEINTVLEQVNLELENKIADRTATLQTQIELEHLIARISTEFTNWVGELDIPLRSALQQLGEFAKADSCSLVQMSSTGDSIQTHGWSIDSSEPLASLPQLGVSQNDPSTLWVSIEFRHQPFGWVGLTATHSTPAWTEDLMNALRICGEIFAGTIYRQHTEADLRQTLQQLTFHVENTLLGTIIWDSQFRVQRWSKSAEAIFGWTEAEVLGKEVYDWQFLYEEDVDKVNDELTRLSYESRGNICRNRNYCKDGSVIDCEWYNSSLIDESGNVVSSLSLVQDISNQLAIDRMKDEFISIVSHELRTPLTAIQGALGLLDSGRLNQDSEQFDRLLQLAINNSDRLTHLVNDVLDLERLNSGRIKPEMQDCQVSELMLQAVESVQIQAAKAEISLDPQMFSAVIWADPDLIIQILTNLLSNAIKFSPTHSSIQLSAAPIELDKTQFVQFAVADQGRGIPADKLETIFGRFQQVDLSDARQKGGSGLGLAICKSIVQQHQGRIWAESELQQGSKFFFTIPTFNSSFDAADPQSEEES